MRKSFRAIDPRFAAIVVLMAGALVASGLVFAMPAITGHGDISLAGSDFEIDADANLVVDHEAPALDWANVDQVRQLDTPSGKNDDAFGKGSKENTAAPAVVSGSIPPNKSDLLEFGLYQESIAAGHFLHLYWARVQDPSGTTNMDFEFNQSMVLSANGITPERTPGDLLLTYDLTNGGTVPVLSLRIWEGGAWGAPTDLSASGSAAGSINATAIPAGDSDGLGALDPRTFGEATIDLAIIFDPTVCQSFGSVYLKSRSSDSLNAALKDFIAPASAEISNCGSIQIQKTDDGGAPLAGVGFMLYVDNAPVGGALGDEDVATAQTCTTDAGACSISPVLAGEYWVVETDGPANHHSADPQAITVAADTVVFLEFVNERMRGSILVQKTDADGIPLDGAQFTITPGAIVMAPVAGETGLFCEDGLLFDSYTVTETVAPDGYDNAAGPQVYVVNAERTCAQSIADYDVTATAESTDLTFMNGRMPGAIKIIKTAANHDADGDPPLAGVDFQIIGDGFDQTVTTGADGTACLDGLAVGATYTVTETAVPNGYALDPTNTADVEITQNATCGSGNEATVSFMNQPLSEIQVTFTSLAGPNVTAASITCEDASETLTPVEGDATPGALDDMDETFTALPAGTYTCTVVIAS